MLEINNGYIPKKGEMVKINYLVLDSQIQGIFSMGGDLNLFHTSIVNKDSTTLSKYARLCIDTIHGFIVGCRQPITTIALVRGDAMGGGFEVALSCQVLIAEKEVNMGFPEILFNLFPGMGGYHMLSQRLPVKDVEKMMQSGVIYSSEKLYDMGVVDRIAERDEGKEAVYSYIKQASKYCNSFTALKNVREKLHPVTQEELLEVSKYWVEIAMNLSDRDLKLMKRLVRAQTKKAESSYSDENTKLIEKTA
ncbi:MAG: enoyl-CoA hydratase [Candidatus Dadabacteria bacterium]|nr:enoyl-CoA hydratase [Candidatus Dadabacteria bacterium]